VGSQCKPSGVRAESRGKEKRKAPRGNEKGSCKGGGFGEVRRPGKVEVAEDVLVLLRLLIKEYVEGRARGHSITYCRHRIRCENLRSIINNFRTKGLGKKGFGRGGGLKWMGGKVNRR